MKNKYMIEMMESRIKRDIIRAEQMKNSIAKRDFLNQILGFLSCYLWADGDPVFFGDKTDEVIHLLVYCFDEEEEE